MEEKKENKNKDKDIYIRYRNVVTDISSSCKNGRELFSNNINSQIAEHEKNMEGCTRNTSRMHVEAISLL